MMIYKRTGKVLGPEFNYTCYKGKLTIVQGREAPAVQS